MPESTRTTGSVQEERDRFLDVFQRESAITLKLLEAYPRDQAELQPHERLRTARELAWVFTLEQMLAELAMRDELDVTKGSAPEAPATMAEVIEAFERSRQNLIALVTDATDAQLEGTVTFPTGPGQMGEWPKMKFLWFLLHDQIHHRGQFSVYLRLAGAPVPSIYGPSADEPWF